jgi:hypothetical protein
MWTLHAQMTPLSWNYNKEVLDWADSYCTMRVQIPTTVDHQKYWQRLLRYVREAPLQSK